MSYDPNLQTAGYAIVEAESAEAVRALLASHPHLAAPDAAIEADEMLAMRAM